MHECTHAYIYIVDVLYIWRHRYVKEFSFFFLKKKKEKEAQICKRDVLVKESSFVEPDISGS
jgi:hypothetical protein